MKNVAPVYLQIRDEIVSAILDGQYPAGTMLPSVRALAAQRGVNPLTVAKAYQSLQDDGVAQVRRGVGLFVNEGAPEQLREQGRHLFLTREWPRLRERMRRLGVDPADLPLE